MAMFRMPFICICTHAQKVLTVTWQTV